MNYSIQAKTKFQIKNQKDKEQFFIFLIKKMDVLHVKLIFKKNYDAP